MTARVRLGVSACLLGERVRHDGDHRLDAWVRDTLGAAVELVPICPEVAIGLGTPRPPIRLQRHSMGVRAVGVDHPDLDVTDDLKAFGEATASRFEDMSGYVFKARSPSCGLDTVPVHDPDTGMQNANGRGLHAAAITAARPGLPVIESEALAGSAARHHYLERVLGYHLWRAQAQDRTAAGLVALHRRLKLLLMTRGQHTVRELGRRIGQAGCESPAALHRAYGDDLAGALARPSARGRHADALFHAAGYLRPRLSSAERRLLAGAIHAYREGRAGRGEPLARLRDHMANAPEPWLREQVYLFPPAPFDALLP